MNLMSHDSNTGTLKSEAEERYAAEAKQVEARDFQSQGAGSSPVRNTNNNEMIVGNWTKGLNAFTGKTAIVNDRPFTRLGLRH